MQVITPRLNERQAAEFLGLSHRTLQCWRRIGRGPTFLKIGEAVRYDRAELERYLAAQVRQSTSDPCDNKLRSGD